MNGRVHAPFRHYGWIQRAAKLLWPGLALCVLSGCPKEARRDVVEVDAGIGPPWRTAPKASAPPQGMIRIPAGALLAGTPVGAIPRIADEEMPGVQVMLDSFLIDALPFPNEEGAIPRTGVTNEQARALCEAKGKRLCTELEWERACKGPDNTIYEYGDRYRGEVCGTGKAPRMLPSGYRPGCVSGFGVQDMHGGVWEWTSSHWGRGTSKELFTLRGGNADAGELVGRCANATARPPDDKSPRVGFRCCQGPVNGAKVEVIIEHSPGLRLRRGEGERLSRKLEQALPGSARREMARYGVFSVKNVWDWRPQGNEHLVIGSGCAGKGKLRHCGVLVGRAPPGQVQLLHWEPLGRFLPVMKMKGNPRRVWVYGGDRISHYRRPLWFEWGRVRFGDIQRNTPD